MYANLLKSVTGYITPYLLDFFGQERFVFFEIGFRDASALFGIGLQHFLPFVMTFKQDVFSGEMRLRRY